MKDTVKTLMIVAGVSFTLIAITWIGIVATLLITWLGGNFKENKHYANEYGVELNEYLKHNFNYEELVGWYTMQVLKYLVRAGKKEGESYDKDHNKALDYAGELANLSNENELTEYTTDDIMGFIQELADDFERWEGIK